MIKPMQHFILTPLTAHQCLSCGRDPRIVFDHNHQYIIGRDEHATLNARGHCAECQELRASWTHTKRMETAR